MPWSKVRCPLQAINPIFDIGQTLADDSKLLRNARGPTCSTPAGYIFVDFVTVLTTPAVGFAPSAPFG